METVFSINSLIDPVNQGSSPRSSVTVATTATRIAGKTAKRLKRPTILHVEAGGGSSGATLADQTTGLPGDDPQEQQDKRAVEHEHPDHHEMGGNDWGQARKHQECRQRGGQRRENRRGSEPAEPERTRLLPLSKCLGDLSIQ